jgi:hypothetical protein
MARAKTKSGSKDTSAIEAAGERRNIKFLYTVFHRLFQGVLQASEAFFQFQLDSSRSRLMARRFFNKEYHFNTPRLEKEGSDETRKHSHPTIASFEAYTAIKAF